MAEQTIAGYDHTTFSLRPNCPGGCYIIYAHQRLVTIGDCIRDLEIIAKASEPEDLANRVQFIPL